MGIANRLKHKTGVHERTPAGRELSYWRHLWRRASQFTGGAPLDACPSLLMGLVDMRRYQIRMARFDGETVYTILPRDRAKV